MALIRSHQNVSVEPRGLDTDVCWQIVVGCFGFFSSATSVKTTAQRLSECVCVYERCWRESHTFKTREPSFTILRIFQTETKTNYFVYSPDALSTDNLLRIKVLYHILYIYSIISLMFLVFIFVYLFLVIFINILTTDTETYSVFGQFVFVNPYLIVFCFEGV